MQNEKCIVEIRKFYNLDCTKPGKSKFDEYYNLYCFGFVEQSNFIFEYYCKYKNAYYEIMRRAEVQENLEIKDWYDLLDNYYIKIEEEK